MRIANPIYDTVFKYLMEDNQLAKLLLSTILGEEIVELDFKPQEHTTTVAPRSLTVYRLDFAATVENAQGERRQVLIEIQKAKLASDIMRFRRYLGDQYRNPGNVQELVDAARGYSKRRALPLLTIYFLGHGLEYTKAPVIRVRRECIDATTGERLSRKEPFIEGLTHDSTIGRCCAACNGRSPSLSWPRRWQSRTRFSRICRISNAGSSTSARRRSVNAQRRNKSARRRNACWSASAKPDLNLRSRLEIPVSMT
jgi:hypothetical protein